MYPVSDPSWGRWVVVVGQSDRRWEVGRGGRRVEVWGGARSGEGEGPGASSEDGPESRRLKGCGGRAGTRLRGCSGASSLSEGLG